MAETVRDVMTPHPVTLHASMPIRDAARTMRDLDVADVLVRQDDGTLGVVTDRDLVVLALAEGADPDRATIGEFSRHDLATVDADDSVDVAIEVAREQPFPRVPVLDGGSLAGVVSLTDLTRRLDPASIPPRGSVAGLDADR